MFEPRDLPDELAAVRRAHAPDALVVDTERDFRTLEPAVAESLGMLVDAFEPFTAPDEWVPASAPDALQQYAGDAFTVGLPGDGGVAWTRQTRPPTVFVKPRLEGSPDAFVEFLLAEALVQVDVAPHESFLAFFGDQYPALAAATPLSPADSYQLGAALYDAYVGRLTRPVFEGWADDRPDLHAAWVDAGERLGPRLADLPGEVARGETEFAAAAELACAALKHGLDLPDPFAALDTSAYEQHGAGFAVQWAETTFEKLREE